MHYYTDAQHEVWHLLYKNQYELAKLSACNHFINGLEILELDPKQIPWVMDVSKRLVIASGWKLQPVTGLVNHMEFFKLLSNKQFPVSTRCRSFQEIHFCNYPDIFHEIFGHAPMLTYPGIANFLEAVGKLGLTLNKPEQEKLSKLTWFTIESGLIYEDGRLKIFGAAILTSYNEIKNYLNNKVEIKQFDINSIINNNYSYHSLQKVYYAIDSFDELNNILKGE